ncbi:3-deoxy-manno-octulosonate cytidylyltransferase [Bremerella cremea]|uniref:3-deoxy-manno-octulosonate cytidylyltransferase n=1 Tax=Bremerella cremea TaxID=1031537 RepID=A0A368KR83_9BACT|nr:3-deoxy-manno-octulosonate cytidylyltransferase [Bremerella cremea]RCS46038.1 3-deoxy-manno-octulosonate cytidylyltransferase [Bremerella cremea]
MKPELALSLSSLVVIPARLHSSRLPEKLLLAETGKPLIQHTYEAACLARGTDGVVVATDHDTICQAVQGFGGEAVMTSETCASGTDRVAEVARSRPDVDIFINVQGDEPEISAEAIETVRRLLELNPEVSMATLGTPIRSLEKLQDPACVKVVCAENGRALYFSRSPIPHVRDGFDEMLSAEPAVFYQHLGIYAYRRDFLLKLATAPPSPLEQLEKLEQLRVLEMGEPILVGKIAEPSIGIDTPSDYAAFVRKMSNC